MSQDCSLGHHPESMGQMGHACVSCAGERTSSKVGQVEAPQEQTEVEKSHLGT